MHATVEMLEQLLAELPRPRGGDPGRAIFLLNAETQMRILGGDRGGELLLQGELYTWRGIPLVLAPDVSPGLVLAAVVVAERRLAPP
jgi:hypothetical protein